MNKKNHTYFIIILLLLFFNSAFVSLAGIESSPKDPLKGERKIYVNKAFRLQQSKLYWGVCFGGICCSPNLTEFSYWKVENYGKNGYIIRSLYYKEKPYLHVNPDAGPQAYCLGIQNKFDEQNCYFEKVPTNDGKFALKSKANGKYLAPVYDKLLKINILDAIKDEIDPSCIMETILIPGESETLGEPVHWYTMDIKPILVLGEPPKHIDYITDADGKKTELNVSRTSGFYSLFKDESQKEIDSSNTHTSDWNFGVEVSASTKESKGIPVVGSIKAEVSAGAGYSYNKHEEDINKDYKSVTTKEELKAVNSDFLVVNKSSFHIWSYPIIEETDIETTEGKKGPLFYQIVVPDPDINNPYYLSGTLAEWYQPIHQNGNVLSYPWSISQIQEFEKSKNLNLLTDPKSIATDNNEMSFYVGWKESTQTGKEVSSSHKFDTEESLGVSFEIKGVGGSGTVKTNYDQTWKTLTTSNTKLTQSKGITITKEPLMGAPFYAYEIHPMIYTKGSEKKEGSKIEIPTGEIKLSYLVNFPEDFTSYRWWKKYYSGKPDIALNLPCQWRMTDSSGKNWKFDKDSINFNLMKGLFVIDSSGERFFYTCEEGEPVKVQFRVYNLSFHEARNIAVRLKAQESSDGETWGERFLVGTYTIPFLPEFANTDNKNNWDYASVDFDTTGKAGKYYRFWVVVNPKNKIEELPDHGYKEKYSNNEGFFPIPLTIVQKQTNKTAKNNKTKSTRISLSSLKVSDTKPKQGEQVTVSLWVGVQDADASQVMISFFKNRPQGKKELFDMEIIPHIKKGGRYYVQVPFNTLDQKGDWQISVTAQAHTPSPLSIPPITTDLKIK